MVIRVEIDPETVTSVTDFNFFLEKNISQL